MTSPRFDLATQGIAGFTRTCLTLPKRKVARDPMSGLLDASNTTFFTTYSPIQTSGSLVIFDGPSQVHGVADYDTGEVTLASPPITQPLATYNFVPYNSGQMAAIVVSGFQEMEARWPRNYRLVDSSGSSANEFSASILIADHLGQEPVCAGVEFTDSVVNVAFLLACIEYVYYLMSMGDASLSDYAFRETMKGMSVDKSKRPGNIDMQLARLESRMQDILEQAQAQYYGGANYGGFVGNLSTASYMLVHEWQTESALYDYRNMLAYTNPVRSF